MFHTTHRSPKPENMSDHEEGSARPTKRARLDGDAAPSLSPAPSATAAQVVGATQQPTIDQDLEREIRAGITEYVCPDNLGFNGVLKQRYTDFLVNEIGLDGKVVHLTSTKVNKKDKPAQNGTGSNAEPVRERDVTEKNASPEQEVAVIGQETTSLKMIVDDGLEQAAIEVKEDTAQTNEDAPPKVLNEEPEEEVRSR